MTEDCSDITSLTIPNKVESTGLTNFESEACEAIEVLGKHYAKPSSSVVQSDIQNLTEYFARPRLIGSGVLNSSQNVQFSQVINPVNLFTTLFPFGNQRLTGVFGARYSPVFTVQVATTPFHQGLLAATFQYGEVTDSSALSVGLTGRGFFPGMNTSIPHVRMDLATTTMVTLKVPFLSTLEYHRVENDIALGTFTLMPIDRKSVV